MLLLLLLPSFGESRVTRASMCFESDIARIEPRFPILPSPSPFASSPLLTL